MIFFFMGAIIQLVIALVLLGIGCAILGAIYKALVGAKPPAPVVDTYGFYKGDSASYWERNAKALAEDPEVFTRRD